MNTRECQLGCLELLFAGIYEREINYASDSGNLVQVILQNL